MSLVQAAVLAYFLGSIPAGWFLYRWFTGQDIRAQGSGNIGATNVLRLMGWKAGLATLAIDAGKGALAVTLARHLWGGGGPELAAGLAALVGHMLPVGLRFRGGKGVATGLGVFAALAPWHALAAVVVFALSLAATRYVSLASMLAASSVPVGVAWREGLGARAAVALAGALLVLCRHHANVGRLVRGAEPRLGSPAPP